MKYDLKTLLFILTPVVLLIFSLVFLAHDDKGFLFFADSIEGLRSEIKNLEKKKYNLKQKTKVLRKEVEKFNKLSKSFMTGSSSDSKIKYRQTIEKAANQSGLGIRSLSSIREISKTKEVSFYEINLNAESNIEQMVKFLNELYRGQPRIYWKNFNARPNNVLKPKYLIVSGNACAVFWNNNNKVQNKNTKKKI